MSIWNFGTINVGFSEEYQEGRSQVTPDAGSNFERESITTTKNILSGTLKLDYDDFLLFKQFYLDTKQGSEMFIYYDCRLGLYKEARFFGNWTAREYEKKWIINLSLIFEPIEYGLVVGLSYNGCPCEYNGKKAGVSEIYEL